MEEFLVDFENVVEVKGYLNGISHDGNLNIDWNDGNIRACYSTILFLCRKYDLSYYNDYTENSFNKNYDEIYDYLKQLILNKNFK